MESFDPWSGEDIDVAKEVSLHAWYVGILTKRGGSRRETQGKFSTASACNKLTV